jgi:hypothetical protein
MKEVYVYSKQIMGEKGERERGSRDRKELEVAMEGGG